MKTFFTAIFTIIIALSTLAQEQKIYIGVDAGPSLTTLRNKSNNGIKSKTGFAAGASFEYLFSQSLGIKSGLLFEQKGAKDELLLTDEYGNYLETNEVTIDYNYLILPLLFAYHTPGKTGFYANAGPYFGFLLSNIVYYEDTDQISGRKDDFTSETNAVDFGLSFGIGVNVGLSENLLLGIDLKENLGLTKTIGDSKTNSVCLLAGLKYIIRTSN